MPQMRVTEAARDRLEALAEMVKRRPGQVVEMLSHADVATLLECEARRVLALTHVPAPEGAADCVLERDAGARGSDVRADHS